MAVIHCPYCNGVMENAAELAGTSVLCPHCSRPFQMPGVPIASVAFRSASVAAQRKRKSNVLVWLLFLAVVGGGGWFAVTRFGIVQEGILSVPSKYRSVITDHLDRVENKYEIVKWYTPIKLDSAYWVLTDGLNRMPGRPFQESGVGIRVKYRTNEGFDQWANHDKVFCINDSMQLITFNNYARSKNPWLYVKDFVIGKPGDK